MAFIIRRTLESKCDELQLDPAQREAYARYRPNRVRAPLSYKARPLNRIWATAPYLHNGSIPNLYEVLIPTGKRSKTFYLIGLESIRPPKYWV